MMVWNWEDKTAFLIVILHGGMATLLWWDELWQIIPSSATLLYLPA